MMVSMMSSVEDCSTQEIGGSADAEPVERLAGTARGEIGGEELATPEHDPVGRRISGRQKDRKSTLLPTREAPRVYAESGLLQCDTSGRRSKLDSWGRHGRSSRVAASRVNDDAAVTILHEHMLQVL